MSHSNNQCSSDKSRKRLTLFTPTEDMDNIIKIVESLEKLRSIN